MGNFEVYIEEPPLRKRLDRLTRWAMYISTAMWAVLSVLIPESSISSIPHGPMWDSIIAFVLGMSSIVAAMAVLHGKRIVELAASPFVTAGLLPFLFGAVLDDDWALVCAVGSLIFANLARGNALRTAVRRATTIKEMVDINGSGTN